jgi:hypothetical protein
MRLTHPFLGGIALVALAAALTGCQSGGGGAPATADFSDEAYGLSVKLADTIGRCWFAPGETAFAGYIYTPERNAGVSRIMIVKKDNPTGLPVLVVQATTGSSATIYGPLAESASGARIRADVARWAKGGTTCA